MLVCLKDKKLLLCVLLSMLMELEDLLLKFHQTLLLTLMLNLLVSMTKRKRNGNIVMKRSLLKLKISNKAAMISLNKEIIKMQLLIINKELSLLNTSMHQKPNNSWIFWDWTFLKPTLSWISSLKLLIIALKY